jgi:Zn-dependent peptidase ImmA (M78 family)
MLNYSHEWQSLSDEVKALLSKYHTELPVKLGALAKELGLTVKVRTLEAGISGKILGVDFGYEIQINKHEIKERQRFTFAHEISHYLLHRDLIGEGISDTILYRSALSDSKEAEANRLAADILMPKFIVNQLINNNSDLPSVQQYECVAKELGVSVTALNIRMGK